jgi:hypothetical protein
MITITDQSSVTQNNLMLAQPLHVRVDHFKNKSIATRFHIPGRPEQAKEGDATHVRVRTSKNLNGQIVCNARKCDAMTASRYPPWRSLASVRAIGTWTYAPRTAGRRTKR